MSISCRSRSQNSMIAIQHEDASLKVKISYSATESESARRLQRYIIELLGKCRIRHAQNGETLIIYLTFP